MRWRMDPAAWEKRVTKLMRVMRREKDMPPLIVQYVNGGFERNG